MSASGFTSVVRRNICTTTSSCIQCGCELLKTYFIVLFDFDFVSVLLGLLFGVYTIRVTISCIYYFVFTISLYFMHSINLSRCKCVNKTSWPVEELVPISLPASAKNDIPKDQHHFLSFPFQTWNTPVPQVIPAIHTSCPAHRTINWTSNRLPAQNLYRSAFGFNYSIIFF